MKKENKHHSDDEILRGWLESVPYRSYNKTRHLLVARCNVSRSTFDNWYYGRCRIPGSAKVLINSVTMQISGEEIFTIAQPPEICPSAKAGSPAAAI